MDPKIDYPLLEIEIEISSDCCKSVRALLDILKWTGAKDDKSTDVFATLGKDPSAAINWTYPDKTFKTSLEIPNSCFSKYVCNKDKLCVCIKLSYLYWILNSIVIISLCDDVTVTLRMDNEGQDFLDFKVTSPGKTTKLSEFKLKHNSKVTLPNDII